jgi:hypothetical protein
MEVRGKGPSLLSSFVSRGGHDRNPNGRKPKRLPYPVPVYSRRLCGNPDSNRFFEREAVDDLKQAIVRDGSTVALSAAMPGLVGATLRRGGFFASLRPAITSAAEPEAASPKPGRVILKLFNLLVPELAPALLAEGVGLTEGQLKRFLEGLQGDFWENCRGAVWDGRPIEGPFSLPPFGPEKEDGIRIKVTWID